MSHELIIPGRAVAQGRPRATLRNRKAVAAGAGAVIGTYDPETSRAWKAAVRESFEAARTDAYPLAGPLRADLTFFLAKPKSKPAWKKHADVRPDLDNYCKAILDSLIGLAYPDDAAICEMTCAKLYCTYTEGDRHFTIEPCVRIVLTGLIEAPSPRKARP